MKIDLHCHSFYSNDGISSPEKLLKTALQKGLDGIALTDHNTIAGWEEAKKIAEKLNAFLILGQEIKVKKNGKKIGEVLALFLKKEIKSREIFDVFKEVKEQGGIIIIPHPFHFPENFKDNLEKYLPFIDGIEVFNARHPLKIFDKKALKFAQKNNLAFVAGSDTHWEKDVGSAYTLVKEANNLEDFKKAILERKTEIEGKKSSFWTLFFPFLAKTKHFLLPK